VKRILIGLALAAALAGCANKNEPLPMVGAGDPVWQLNPCKWGTSENALTTPPPDHSLRGAM
jgi:hypothetical protein